MPSLGFGELIILGAVLLLIFGPQRLPEIARGLGEGLREFKRSLVGEAEADRQLAELADSTDLQSTLVDAGKNLVPPQSSFPRGPTAAAKVLRRPPS